MWDLFSVSGKRKYLNKGQLAAFISASWSFSDDVRTFCHMLALTGCRISEALALRWENIDFDDGQVVIRSLKKRGLTIYRSIPLPKAYLMQLARWKGGAASSDLLWPWCRMTGYRRICEVMEVARIRGDCASPKGLRHGFGVRAIQSGVPLNLVQRWLGHADIKTTAIYTNAFGPEERKLASRMWERDAYCPDIPEANAPKRTTAAKQAASTRDAQAPEMVVNQRVAAAR